VVKTSPKTRGLELYLYADGGGAEEAVVDYRRVHVDVASSYSLSVLKVPSVMSEPPPTQWKRTGASSFDVEIDETTDSFILVLNESFDPGWRLGGLPEGRNAEHLMVEGYANGWRVSPGPPLDVTIEYGPDTWWRFARFVSLAGLLVAIAILLKRPVMHRLRAWQT
jgi:arabinofuranan 3-O-arabinosyltransferase